MKNILFITTLFCFSFVSCKKDQEGLFDQWGHYKYGYGNMTINGRSIAAKKILFGRKEKWNPEEDTVFLFEMQIFTQNDELREVFGVRNLRPKIGKYFFPKIEVDSLGHPDFANDAILYKPGFAFFGADGDVVEGSYSHPWVDSNSYVEITELNIATGDVKGNFKAKMLKLKDFSLASLPDTIYITEGSFSTKIAW